jgi:prepilin-type N-terminal cleavage/methylation domain-containing protein
MNTHSFFKILKLREILEGEQGFTLVEVMVSSLLLTGALVGASAAVVQQAESQAAMNLQNQGRQAMREIVSSVQSQPERFPAIQSKSYIGCFTPTGQQVTVNLSKNTGFVPISTTAATFLTPLSAPSNPNLPGCAGGQNANIEIHVQHTSVPVGTASSDTIEVHGILLVPTNSTTAIRQAVGSSPNQLTSTGACTQDPGGKPNPSCTSAPTATTQQFVAANGAFDNQLFQTYQQAYPPAKAPAATPPVLPAP